MSDYAIFKYSIFDTTLLLPTGSKVLKVGNQGGILTAWVKQRVKYSKTSEFKFIVIGTGNAFPKSSIGGYIDTVFMGSLVWHIFLKIQEKS